jgi:hypothetical protein
MWVNESRRDNETVSVDYAAGAVVEPADRGDSAL